METKNKPGFPEAPVMVKAHYKGFEIILSKFPDGPTLIPQVPGIIALIDKLAEAGFTPTSGVIYQAPQEKSPDKENGQHLCPLHGVEMKKYEKGSQSWYAHRIENGWCNGKKK